MPFHLTKGQRINYKFYYQNNENGAAAGRLFGRTFSVIPFFIVM